MRVEYIKAYLDHCREKGYKEGTLQCKARLLSRFADWCEERSINTIDQVQPHILKRYQRHLYHYRSESGEALNFELQRRGISEVKSFFLYLSLEGHIQSDPGVGIELPRKPRRLPAVLSVAEIESILKQPPDTLLGIRDRALLELLYATGISREECLNLTTRDLDLSAGWIQIKMGLREKDRSVPLIKRAIYWLSKYLEEVRPFLTENPQETRVFLGRDGKALPGPGLGCLVSHYIKAAGIDKRGAFRLFRNSLTALLIEEGMDLRYVQEILGHVALESTRAYTRVSIGKLKEVHRNTHPAGRGKK